MISFKKKIGKTFIVFCILLLIVDLLSFLITKKIDLELLLINIFYIIIFLWQVIKYHNLKKRGVIQHQVRYIIETKRYGKVDYKYLYAFIKLDNGMEQKVGHNAPIKAFDNIPENGFVDVLVDSNNYKNYYILLETVKGK